MPRAVGRLMLAVQQDQSIEVSGKRLLRGIVEYFGISEGLRRLGFPADQVFVCLEETRDSSDVLFVRLASMPELHIAVCKWDSEESMQENWKELCEWILSAPEEHLQTVWETSATSKPENLATLVSALEHRGIQIPAFMN